MPPPVVTSDANRPPIPRKVLIEDNWDLGRIGNDSSDEKAGTLNGLFDFDHIAPKLILDPATGAVLPQHHW
jgi:hypothetical protein